MNSITMKPFAMFGLPIRHKPWRPSHLRWVMQDIAGTARQSEQDHRTHLRAVLEWTCRAQDACQKTVSGCVAAGWTFESGWQPASSEVTGYLIETLLPAADYLAWPELAVRARAMLDALLAQPDTGGIGRIHGLLAGHAQIGHADCLERAVRSGHALLDTPLTTAAQHAGTARALACVGMVAGDAGLLDAARHHLQAVLALQTPCGWFPDSAMHVSTGNLANILRSLIELASVLGQEAARQAAVRVAQDLRRQLTGDGWLSGAFDDGWTPAASHASVPGLAQLAVCWLRLARITRDAGWRDPAWRALAWIKRNQRTTGDAPALRGALPTAVPIWGGPAAFSLDVAGAKHFADALMMDMVGIDIPPDLQVKLT